MADQAANSLTYGQFGQALYDDEHEQWGFERYPGHASSWQILGESNVAIPSTSTQGTAFRERDRKEAPSVRHGKQVKALVRVNPEFQPVSEILPELARVSEALEDAVARYDPAKGNLIAFGNIPDEASMKSVAVVAFPSGPAGGNLRVVQVQYQRRGWDDSRDAWLEVPTIYGEEASWRGPGAPIQALTFTQPIERGDTFLAVRMITQTLVFRLTLKKQSGRGFTRLDINLLCDLNINQTGGIPHADIALNPWRTRHFAVIDQNSSWSLWELGIGNTGGAQQTCRGKLSEDATSAAPVDDGWGRIIWVQEYSILAICNRRKLKLLGVANREPLGIQEIDFGTENAVGWVLDVSVLQSRPNHFCVVTSTHVLLYRVGPAKKEAISAKRVTKFQHFRHAEDISLRLHVVSDGDDALMLLRSGVNSTVMSYRLKFSKEEFLALQDPKELPLPATVLGQMTTNDISDLHFEPISMGSQRIPSNHRSSRPAYDCIERGVRFYSLTTLHHDLSLRQTVYFEEPKTGSSIHLEPVVWKSKLSESVSTPAEVEPIESADIYDNVAPSSSRTKPTSAYVQRRTEQASARSGDGWTVNYELSVRRLNDVDVSEVTGTEEIVENVRDLLRNGNSDDAAPIRTVRELVDGEITVRDVEEATERFRELHFIESIAPRTGPVEDVDEEDELPSRLGLRDLPLPPAPNPDLGYLNSLSSVHQALVENWITPLSDNIPDVIRMSKERLARRIAAEVFLARQVVRLEKPERGQQSQSQSQSQAQPWDLPDRPGASPSPSRAPPSLCLNASSQLPPSSLPTPSASAAASTLTGSSSHPSTFSAPEITRLNRYTTFSTPAPPPLPRALNRVLSHWGPGADPATYDWRGTSRQLSRHDEQDLGAEEMTEKERRRLRRRTERYVRRQRREAEESQRARVLSSQAPEIVSASQPPPALGVGRPVAADSQRDAIAGSSQSFGLSQVAVSQVLSGRHGGRRPARKKRRSGF